MVVLKKALFIDRDGTIIKDIPYSADACICGSTIVNMPHLTPCDSNAMQYHSVVLNNFGRRLSDKSIGLQGSAPLACTRKGYINERHHFCGISVICQRVMK